MKKEKVIKGVALLIAISFVVILGIGAVVIAKLHSTGIRLARRQKNSTRAFYIAEGGFERTRYDIDQDDDWMDGDINGISIPLGGDTANFYLFDYGQIDPAIRTSLGGEFTVWLKNVAGEPAEIWIKSRGDYQNETRAVKVRLKSSRRFASPTGITSAIIAGGSVELRGSVEVDGEIEQNADISFENVFGVNMAEMEQLTQTYYPATYYTTSFSNNSAEGITWIKPNATDPKITDNTWNGSGLLIVEDNLKITGGTFNGVIWVVGVLDISGNPVINGSIFVECEATIETTLTGNPTITYDQEAISNTFSVLTSLPSVIELWQEE